MLAHHFFLLQNASSRVWVNAIHQLVNYSDLDENSKHEFTRAKKRTAHNMQREQFVFCGGKWQDYFLFHGGSLRFLPR